MKLVNDAYRMSIRMTLGIIAALIICLAFVHVAEAKPKVVKKKSVPTVTALQATQPSAIRFNLGDSNPEPAYTEAFFRSLMIKQVAENIRFEFTHSGFNWKMNW